MTARNSNFSGLLYYNPVANGFNPVASATLRRRTSTPILEGSQVDFEVVTWNIPDGTTLYYRIVGLNNMNYNQFTDVNDSVVITNHRGYFSIGIFENHLTAPGAQTFDIIIEKTFGGGGELARVAGIPVVDSSQSPTGFVISVNDLTTYGNFGGGGGAGSATIGADSITTNGGWQYVAFINTALHDNLIAAVGTGVIPAVWTAGSEQINGFVLLQDVAPDTIQFAPCYDGGGSPQAGTWIFPVSLFPAV